VLDPENVGGFNEVAIAGLFKSALAPQVPGAGCGVIALTTGFEQVTTAIKPPVYTLMVDPDPETQLNGSYPQTVK
jgi:hypothetical protein